MAQQQIVHTIEYLRNKKQCKKVAFIKKNKKTIIGLINSKTRVGMVEKAVYEHVYYRKKWYVFNTKTLQYEI